MFRVGIDVQHLGTSHRSGIFVYLESLLEALNASPEAGSIRMLMRRHSGDRARQLKCDLGRMGLSTVVDPRFAYRFRMRWSALRGISVLHHNLSGLPSLDCIANVFTIFDLSTVHYPHLHLRQNVELHDLLVKSIVKDADAVIAISDATKRDVVETLGIPESRVHVTALAPGKRFRPIDDTTEMAAGLEALGLLGVPYILSVGTLEPRKNLPLLIRAFARLRQCHPQLPHRLVLAGAKGWLYDSIFETIAEAGLEDQVMILGHAGPLEILYNGADLFVYPSLFEGFGLPPLEAMACGVPVITSNTSAMPEVVGGAAITVDPHDEAALSEAMARVLADPDLRGRMSRDGRERARSFTWERTARATLDAYKWAYEAKF